MRAVCLDIGEVRCGVAATDASGTMASPVAVLPMGEVLAGAPSWRRILEDFEPEVLVCGRPLTMSGEPGPQAEKVMEQAREIAGMCGLPLEFTDERLTSAEARRILHEEGLSEKQMRGKVDMVAASLMLEAWLDARS